MAAPRSDPAKCQRCAHYFITHDALFPYGCRAMGFKSRTSPHAEVEAATGAACVAFQLRPAAVRPGRPPAG